MTDLDSQIDQLYALPAADFVAARTALARTLKGADAARVRHLQKPTVVPWAVNQVYWHRRDAYEALMAAGRALRAAQVAALEGAPSDLRAAAAAHRLALSTAVSAAEALARSADVTPSADAVSRMFEALSLAPQPPSEPGRFTEVVAPAGFEALAGITPVVPPPAGATPRHEPAAPSTATRRSPAAERKRLEAEAEAARAAADRAVADARRRVQDAQEQQAVVRARVDLARQQLERSESSLREASALLEAASEALARAEAERGRL